MLTVLPLVLLLQLWELFIVLKENSLREGLIKATISWGAFIVLLSEILSFFNGLSYWPILMIWIGAITVLGLFRRQHSLSFISLKPLSLCLSSFPSFERTLNFHLFASSILILGTTLFIAIVSPPNNWDSLSYHLPRVMHWIQNANLSPYPTGITRQLFMPPLSELIILHFQILNGGSDRFINCIQWGALLFSISTATLVVAKLGGGKQKQLLAAVLISTTRIIILQASSTQNDILVAAWVVSLSYFSVLFSLSRPKWDDFFYFGLAFALGLCTKGTFAILGGPLFLYTLFMIFRRWRGRKFIDCLATVFFLVLLINGSLWIRNLMLWGHFLGPSWLHSNLFIEGAHPKSLLLNLIKNLTSEILFFHSALNKLFEQFIYTLPRHLNISMEDPKYNMSYWNIPYSTSKNPLHEDLAPSSLHFLLSLLFWPIWLSVKRKFNNNHSVMLAICATLGLLLLSAILKSSPWSCRYHCAFFILMAIPMSLLYGGFKWGLRGLSIFLLIAALPPLLANEKRPLLKNSQGYTLFTVSRRELYYKYDHVDVGKGTVDAFQQSTMNNRCLDIGVIFDENSLEYLYWMHAKYEKLPIRYHGLGKRNPSISIQNRTTGAANLCSIIVDNPKVHFWTPPEAPITPLKHQWTKDGVSLYQ